MYHKEQQTDVSSTLKYTIFHVPIRSNTTLVIKTRI